MAMSFKEALAAVKAGSMSVDEAERAVKSNTFGAKGVTRGKLSRGSDGRVKGGRIIVRDGAEVEMTDAQAVVLLRNVDAIKAELARFAATAPVAVPQVRTGKDKAGNATTSEYTAYVAADSALVGWNQGQCDMVADFHKSAAKSSKAA